MNIANHPYSAPQAIGESKQLYPELKGECTYYPYTSVSSIEQYKTNMCADSNSLMIGQIPPKLTPSQVFAILEQCGAKPELITDIKNPKIPTSPYCFAKFSPDTLEAAKSLNHCILPDINGYWVNTTRCANLTKFMLSLAKTKSLRSQQNFYGLSRNLIVIELRNSCKHPSAPLQPQTTNDVASHFFTQKSQFLLPYPPLYELHKLSFLLSTASSNAVKSSPFFVTQNRIPNPSFQNSTPIGKEVTVRVGHPQHPIVIPPPLSQTSTSPQAENSSTSPPKKSSLAQAFLG